MATIAETARVDSVRAYLQVLALMTPRERAEYLSAYQTHAAAAGAHAVTPAQFARAWINKTQGRIATPARVCVFRPVDELPDTYADELAGLAEVLDSYYRTGALPPVLLDQEGAVVAEQASIAAARLLDLDLVPTLPYRTEGK